MKVIPDLAPTDFDVPAANEFQLPQGIIGFPEHRRAELLYMPDHLPFLWMRLHGADTISFIVLEPGGIVPGYEPEIFETDAEQLGIINPAEAMILNIVTLKQQRHPVEATVNLVGPLVINRRTRIGRQLVISNYSKYSAHHLLVDNSQSQPAARTA